VRVLVVGSGGREHALAAKLARSPEVSELLCAPGNGGTSAIPGVENVPVQAQDVPALVALARARGVDFVVVGPEAPLVDGLCDALAEAGIEAFGPRRAAAQLEGSKAFSKRFMQKHGIPTARAHVFDDAAAALAHVRALGRPLVVKADGLAAGKGVIVAATVAETEQAITRVMTDREFGAAGARVVLEERLEGEEVSYHVLLDGERFVPLAPAQDHKRVFDEDRGPNTGGMGAYSPVPVVTKEVEQRILERVVEPTVAGLRAEGITYRGVLFIGLMIKDGEPHVVEYNVRFGDPEAQVLLARLHGDLLPLLRATARGELDRVRVEWEAPAAICIVLAAGGYPGAYDKGLPIRGLAAAAQLPGVEVFHAGTAAQKDGEVVTAGGRVLAVSAHGGSIAQAVERAYGAAARIEFQGVHYRRDIAWRARQQ
jgi:phosphoribosylamine--glycine ligase